MPPEVPMRDMVILLPGILGSVLKTKDKQLWAPSAQAVWHYLSNLGSSVDDLRLNEDDPDRDELDDGIRATKLMPDLHLVPGFWKIDGYSGIRNFLTGTFEFIEGDLEKDGPPANYFEFPYDWRRDNRFTAKKLKQLIDRELPKWQTRQPQAKVILVAHSMGGLISRYYLEVLGGWTNCRTLITFGTPFRGSIKALKYFEEGYKQLFLDFTDVVRSFTSVYQLLPRYEMIQDVGNQPGTFVYQRPADFNRFQYLDQERAKAAYRDFHLKIDDAVKENEKQEAYRKGFKILPIVGFGHETLQSAKFSEGHFSYSNDLPEGAHPILGDGDGIVPRLSAIPVELSEAGQEWFVNQKHASLQNKKNLLEELGQKLAQLQVSGLEKYLGPDKAGRTTVGMATLSLKLEDLYLKDEPVIIQAAVANFDNPGTLLATVQPISGQGPSVKKEFRPEGAEWSTDLSELAAGSYRIEVRTKRAGPGAPTPVSDVFEVMR